MGVTTALLCGTLFSFTAHKGYLFVEGGEAKVTGKNNGDFLVWLTTVGVRPHVLSLFVSFGLILLAVSCWVKKVGTAIVLWIAYGYGITACSVLVQDTAGRDLVDPILLMGFTPVLALGLAYLAFIHGNPFSEKNTKGNRMAVLSIFILFTLALILLSAGQNHAPLFKW
jgi:hypothetical protein